MPESRPTTIRFSEPVYRRLEQACDHAGLTVNALVIVACLEWLDRHAPPSMRTAELGLQELSPIAPFFRRLGFGTRRRGREQPFDRFTGRAKNALALAQADATEAGRPITPTHLLLGLVLEGEGIAGQVLGEAGVTAATVQSAIDADPGEGVPGEPVPEVKRAMDLALQASASLGHRYIGTEHVLLGLVRLGGVPLAGQELEGLVLKRLKAE